MISNLKAFLVVLATATIAFIAGVAWENHAWRNGIASAILDAQAEAHACFEAATHKEAVWMARAQEPTDRAGSTLGDDIAACWATFGRRSGERR